MRKVLCFLITVVAFAASTTAFSQIYSIESRGQVINVTEDEYTIRFALVSDSLNGEEWISRLEMAGIALNIEVEAILMSDAFVPTRDTIAIGIIKGEKIADPWRFDGHIRNKAREDYYFKTPTLETAVLIRYYLSDKIMKQMGLDWVTIMTSPITPTYDTDKLLLVAGHTKGYERLSTTMADSGYKWKRPSGFAFIWYN